MNPAKYRIGIDFGTSQTKICVTKQGDDPNNKSFIFHRFSQVNKYLLPSTIKLTADGKCQFGLNEPGLIRFFKMKALFDADPNYIIKNNGVYIDKLNLTQQKLEQYPELCCILYLTYCLLDVTESFEAKTERQRFLLKPKTEVKSEQQKNLLAEQERVEKQQLTTANEIKPEKQEKTKQSWFSRIFGKRKREQPSEVKNEGIHAQTIGEEKPTINVGEKATREPHITPSDSIEFNYTIGIPTEYECTKNNYHRRCKQYMMLYLAVQLSNDLKSKDAFNEQHISSILEKIENFYTGIGQGDKINQEYFERYGLFVIAETTAGIIPVRDRLQRVLNAMPDPYAHDRSMNEFKSNHMGNYMTMDVGAGTTDVSFFKFYIGDTNVRMKYYASKSIEEASNILIKNYLKQLKLGAEPTEYEIANFYKEDIQSDIWNQAQLGFRTRLFNIIRDRASNLFFRIVKIFRNNTRSNWHYEFIIAKGCKVYGGGSRFNEFSKGELLLHNGGVSGYAPQIQTYTILEKFINPNEFNFNLVRPDGRPATDLEKTEIRELLDILNTALGLSIVDYKNRPDGDDGWIDPIDPGCGHGGFEPNGGNGRDGGNGGMALYDVFNRDWIDRRPRSN